MKQLFIFIFLIFLFACESDYKIPQPQNQNTEVEVTTSISAVVSALDPFEENTITFSEDLIIEGYVVSSDKAGNFYNELIIQDKPENPTSGIALQIDESSLFERFPFGSKIYIQLNGLSIGYQKGVIELGRLSENEIETLTEFLIDTHIFRSGEIVTITPLPINLTKVTQDYQNLYIELNQMQFPESLLEPTPKTLAAENTDAFDGLRPLFNCETELELLISTSVFSSFKTMIIPSSSGTIKGLLTRDFDDLHYVLKMNSAADIDFTNESRCEANYFKCEQHSFESNTILFQEDFETITNENLLEPLGWINLNITGDEKRWTDKKITNVDNRVLTLSAFNSNLQPLNVWLITPEIDISESTDTYLEFRVRTLFNNGDALKIWVTNAFTGDPLTSNWELLDIDLPNTSSNYVTIQQDISCLSGNIRVAFEYKGYDSILTSTYDIDDIVFYAEAKITP